MILHTIQVVSALAIAFMSMAFGYNLGNIKGRQLAEKDTVEGAIRSTESYA